MCEIKSYVDVKKRIEDLGCNLPKSIAILPRNFESARTKNELIHEDTTKTVRSLWRQSGINETPIEQEGEIFPFIVEESFQWVGPLILFTSTLITQNPQLVDVSIGVISNYLTDWFKGIRNDQKKAVLDAVVEKKDGTYTRVHYEGPPEGMKELPRIIRSTHDEEGSQ